MRTFARTILAVAVLAVIPACSSGGSTSKGQVTTTAPGGTSTTIAARPDGPKASLAELTGGKGVNLVSAAEMPPLKDAGWIQSEYSASGTATAYTGKTPPDGTYDLKPSTSADYATRIVVRRPEKAADFNGTVVVEWLNVSGGLDAAPDWTYSATELIREGYAWVGVSAQQIGVIGGVVAVSTPVSDLAGAGKGLVNLDPARYGDLKHPGDAYSYDIFTQAARALRDPGDAKPLGDLKPEQLLAVGESQSGYMLTTYVDGVQPLTEVFDGFVIHSRGGAAASLGEPGKGIDIAGTLGGEATKVRTDGVAPIIVVETESDVAGILKYLPARQADDDKFRLWEIAGTAHVDRYQLGFAADEFGCTTAINDGPHHFVVASAVAHLRTWVVNGTPPPKAPRLEVDADGKYVTDADGIVVGGIRTPVVDVPVDVLSGTAAPGGSVACLLAGSTVPLSAERVAALYPTVEQYRTKFDASADDAIAKGFVLAADRKALLATASPQRLAG